jgi:MFS family permease
MTVRSERLHRVQLVNALRRQCITGHAARSFVVALLQVAGDIVGMSWAIIVYQRTGISLSVVCGRLGDLHSRHAIAGAGCVIMVVCALFCGCTPTVG